MKLLTVFHPTTYCNLDCTYCWAPDRDNFSKMSLSIVEESLKQVYSISHLSQVDFCWLTGEPTVMGLDYFKSVIKLCNDLKPSSIEISFLMQTNGTLINEEWAEFFKENDFIVGVSIDGPKHIHDFQRINKAGNSSYDLSLRGINYLIKHGVKGGALCVITPTTLQFPPDELFNFFQDKKISWSYLIESKIGENTNSTNAFTQDDIPKLKKYLGRLMDLWGENETSYIKDFDSLSRKLFSSKPTEFDYHNLGCLDIVNITNQGDFFWGNPELMTAMSKDLKEYKYNLFSTTMNDSRASDTYIYFKTQTFLGIEKCATECPFFISCRGGNPAHKYYQHKRFDVSSHLTCELNDKVIADLLLDKMESGLAQ